MWGRIAYLVECWTHDWDIASSNPGRSSRRSFFFRVNFLCWLSLSVCFTPVLPQWHVKDLDHSAKSTGYTWKHIHPWLSELTMLYRLSGGTYQGNKLTCNTSGSAQPQLSQLVNVQKKQSWAKKRALWHTCSARTKFDRHTSMTIACCRFTYEVLDPSIDSSYHVFVDILEQDLLVKSHLCRI